MSESIEPKQPATFRTTLWMWVSHPTHAFRLRTLRGVHENEKFLAVHEPNFSELDPPKRRDEVYRFMNLQRNILWIVRFFALATATVAVFIMRGKGFL